MDQLNGFPYLMLLLFVLVDVCQQDFLVKYVNKNLCNVSCVLIEAHPSAFWPVHH